jgi:hypothetical protein
MCADWINELNKHSGNSALLQCYNYLEFDQPASVQSEQTQRY